MHGKTPSRFFSSAEESRVVRAIQEAEAGTSGEIRVHLLRSDERDLVAYGTQLLEKLGVTRTRARNGVLFLMELKSRRFAVIGDRGIDDKVGQEFWNSIRDEVLERFRREEFAEGLAQGILHCGEKLKEIFPVAPGDVNEQTDQITEE